MSFRHTFITSYIYGHEGSAALERHQKVQETFGSQYCKWKGLLDHSMGYYHGIINSSDLARNDIFEELLDKVAAIEKNSDVPFTLLVSVESGPILSFPIKGRKNE